MKTQRGFTLVEIIFSIAFLSIVSVVILQLFITSNRLNDKAQERNFATLYAANTIESIKANLSGVENLDANSLDNGHEVVEYTYYDGNWQSVNKKDLATYTIEAKITQDPNSPQLNFLVVSVSDTQGTIITSIETAHYAFANRSTP